MDALTSAELERFRAAIVRQLGLWFDEGKSGFLLEVLHRRLEAGRAVAEAYLQKLETPADREELRELARELTIGETYFFRNYDQFRAFAEVALPAALARGGRPSLLSAGCASGEEPYSLAMLVRENPATANLAPLIRAIDVNPAALERAARARYSTWSLRETAPERQERWFLPDGRDLLLEPGIRAAVQFDEKNLTHDDADLWRAGAYDVVFCRNVLMYFSAEQASRAVARIARALRPGGHLFLGHAETLRGLSNEFLLCHTHETFYYQRKGGTERRAPELFDAASTLPPLLGAAASGPSWASGWLDAVQRSSDRIRLLADQPGENRESAGAPPAAAPIRKAADLGIALELLREERYAEALELLQALPREVARDADVLLLRAALLTHCGQLERAEETCRELLEIDELSAGSHYLLALCREGAGDRDGALSHDQVASYLDPAFVMPRLHLGLIARRAGDRATARKELGQALALLPREDASRLLLFGGGFSRDALIALCRAELNRFEGAP